MIIVHSGFTIDYANSTSEYINVAQGTLIDNNSNSVYYVDNSSFKKPISGKVFVYYNVKSSLYEQYVTEIPPQDLDGLKSYLLSVCYLETDENRAITGIAKLDYDDNYDVILGPNISQETATAYKNITFKTENVDVVNGTFTLSFVPIVFVSLYIKDKGTILNSMITNNEKYCTLSESITAEAEVVYGYLDV